MRTNGVPCSLAFNPYSQDFPGIQHTIDACVKAAALNARTCLEVVDRWQLDIAAIRSGKFDFDHVSDMQQRLIARNLAYSRHPQDIAIQAGHTTAQSDVATVKKRQERMRQPASGSDGCAFPGLEGAGRPQQILLAAMNESTSRMLDAFKGSHQTRG
ncbi:hypothetical protein LJR034_009136 [Caballeronia sp. LjRoot34]|uniref:hypothetical protein n=1 Tax=Caballeronia sp. LjRoot34 TaxID=3342325 RepID=UPI003ECD3C02